MLMSFRHIDIAHINIDIGTLKDQIKPIQAQIEVLQNKVKDYENQAHTLETFVEMSKADLEIDARLRRAIKSTIKSVDKSYEERANDIEKERAEVEKQHIENMARIDADYFRIAALRDAENEKLMALKVDNERYHKRRLQRDMEQSAFEEQRFRELENMRREQRQIEKTTPPPVDDLLLSPARPIRIESEITYFSPFQPDFESPSKRLRNY